MFYDLLLQQNKKRMARGRIWALNGVWCSMLDDLGLVTSVHYSSFLDAMFGDTHHSGIQFTSFQKAWINLVIGRNADTMIVTAIDDEWLRIMAVFEQKRWTIYVNFPSEHIHDLVHH